MAEPLRVVAPEGFLFVAQSESEEVRRTGLRAVFIDALCRTT
jgi:hypothetical protein